MSTLKSIFVRLALLLAVAPASASIITVTNSADSGPGSLRAAVSSAASGSTIYFTNTLSGAVITLSSGVLTVSSNLTIDASSLSNGITVSGNNSSPVFLVNAYVTVVLNSLAIINGTNSGGGGGIDNEGGALTLTNCTLSGNLSGNYGGGVYNNGTLTLNECTLSGNVAQTYGGGVYNNGMLTLHQCTLSGNSASLVGGGIYSTRTNVLNQCTVSSNFAAISGGGIYFNGLTYLENVVSNSIVSGNNAGSTAGDDFYGGAVFGGSNIVHYLTSGTYSGTYVSAAPNLAPLGHYGGPTQTMRPLPGSPAINMGSEVAANTFATDQRGYPRFSGTQVDIGAVELQQAAPLTLAATLITSNSAALNGTVTAGELTNTVSVYFEYGPGSNSYTGQTPTVMLYPGYTLTNVQAVLTGLSESATVHYQLVANDGISVNTGGDVAFTTMGPPVLGGLTATPFATSAILNATINPFGAATQYYFEYNTSGGGSFFSVTNTLSAGFGPVNVSVPVSGLTPGTSYSFELVAMNSLGTSSASSPLNFTTGQVLFVGATNLFPAILGTASSGDTITFANTLSGATFTLGSVITLSANITIDASGLTNGITINGNNATEIFQVNSGATVVLNSLIIINGNMKFGGGIVNQGTLALNQCTVSGNQGEVAGGIYNGGTLRLNQCTLCGNSASDGGGIWNEGTLMLNQCTLSGNSAVAVVGYGSGIDNQGQGTLTLNQCTLSGNSAVSILGGGSCIENQGYTNVIFNSIIAGNIGGVDIEGSAVLGGSNIVGSTSGSFSSPAPIITANPNLAPLGNYGGPTQTMPPQPGSPAIDTAATTSFTTDQRGLPRVLGPRPDIGAVEGVFNPAIPLVNPVYPGNGGFRFAFSNLDGANFSILATTNVASSLLSWTVLGSAMETPYASGQYQFTDLQSSNYPQRFYRVLLP